MKFYLPKQADFFGLLRKLSEQNEVIARHLGETVASMDRIHDHAAKAKEIEHAGDEITHEFIDKLNRTFITPIDHEDLYALVKELDDIIDLIENVISNLSLYNCTTSNESLKNFSDLIITSSLKLHSLFDHLEDPKMRKNISAVVLELHELEDEGDELYKTAIRDLFTNEKDAIELIKWKDVYTDLENVMDMFQHISDSVETIVVKAS